MTNHSNPNPYEFLGSSVVGLTDRDEILKAGGADFTVSLQPVVASIPGDMGIPVTSPAPDFRAIVRDDNGSVLSIHKKGYTPFQYGDVYDIAADAVELADSGAYVDTLGVMDGGRQFFASIVLDQIALDPQGVNDLLDVRLNVLSSHDGTLGVTLATGSLRAICANQASAIRKEATTRFCVKHTRYGADRLRIAAKALKMAKVDQAIMVAEATQMLRTPASDEKVLRTIEKLWGKTTEMEEGRGRTRAENRADAIMSIYRSDTCVGAVGHNNWAVFNAFTEYLDHARIAGGSDPLGKMAKATILGAKDDEKAKIGRMLLAA